MNLAHTEKKVEVPAVSSGQNQALHYLTDHEGSFNPALKSRENDTTS